MVTIKDVAKAANVSISTVSCALNGGKGRISEDTKEKIKEIADELGYKPNAIARSLKTKKTDLVGVFLGCFDGPVFGEIRRGIQEICRKYNYEAVFSECEYSPNIVVKLLQQGLIDGAIIHAANIDDETIKSIASENMPIVVLDRDLHNDNISSVLIDNESSGYEIAKYFCELGYNEIGYINGPSIDYDNKKRVEGFLKGVEEYKLKINKSCVLQGDFTQISGYHAMTGFLENNVPPRAIFCANDEMAFGVIKALEEKSYSIPSEVAIIGFDDADMCKFIKPSLTTVTRPSYELGVIAANCLFDKLEHKLSSKKIVLPTKIIKRESCR